MMTQQGNLVQLWLPVAGDLAKTDEGPDYRDSLGSDL